MPYVTVKIVGELTKKQKEEIAKGITDLLDRIAGKEPQYTQQLLAIGGNLLG